MHIAIVRLELSRVMRKLAFCISVQKDEDQLHGNRDADQRLCFRDTDSTIPLFPNKDTEMSSFKSSENIQKKEGGPNPNEFKPPAIFRGCTVRFMLDVVGNPEDRFSHDATQFIHIL